MITRSAVRLYAGIVAGILATAAPAHAQFQPRQVSNPATGESYHVELVGGIWFPEADITVANVVGGQLATTVDLKSDLGINDNKRFGAFDAVLRPARKHKFRVEFIPVRYSQTAVAPRTLVFNGQIFPAGVPVSSTYDWKSFRFGYEYDFVSADAGFFGVIVEGKYSKIDTSLASPAGNGSSSASAVIPGIGGIARIYLTNSLSWTGELTGIKIPTTSQRSGHYADVNTYATLNFSHHVGIEGGYRSFDVQYTVNQDSGTITLKGWYAALAVRF
jgi:hypothetical protein